MELQWFMLLLVCFMPFADFQNIHSPDFQNGCESNPYSYEIVNVLRKGFNDVQLKIDKLNMELREMLSKPEKNKENRSPISCSQVAVDEFVTGFTVTFAPQTVPVKETRLKIENILTNYGSVFTENNEFVTCRDGVYEFLLHLVTDSTENGAWIYKNNKPMTLVWQSGPVNMTGVVSGTTSLVVELIAGETISIRSYRDNLRVSGLSAWSGHIVSDLFFKTSALVSTLKYPGYYTNFASGQDIIAEVGHVNYSLTTGEFICMETGLYKIDFHAIVKSNLTYSVVFQNTSTTHAGVYFDSQHNYTSFTSASSTSLLHLLRGIHLKVAVSHNPRNIEFNNSSVFSVYLLNRTGNTDIVFICYGLRNVGNILTCPNSSKEFNASGYMTCNVKGLYFFSINILAISSSLNNGVQIYKNETPLTIAAFGISVDSAIHQTASTSVVIELNVGDYISFRFTGQVSSVNHTSTLSGYRIIL